MNSVFRVPLLCAVILSVLFASSCSRLFEEEKKEIRLALVGPMSGESESVGRSFRQGVQLCLDAVNARGGVGGRKVVLQVADDRNNPELAAEEARKIAESGEVMAVIGHHYSSCSISAGEVYKEFGIPAITPASTNVKVTEGNPWYFRSSFNDNLQGRFLANYARKVFGKTAVSIIYENDDYGRYLAEVFARTSKELGSAVRYIWKFDADDRLLDDTLRRIVFDLKSRSDAGVVFISTHAGPGVKILEQMRTAMVLNPIMGPDAFASEVFRGGFDAYPKERINPGYYTNGMYVTTPLIFDTSNEKGQQFKEQYRQTYGEVPGWHAAFAYDSALVLINALKNIELDGTMAASGEDRRKLRNHLAGITSVDTAVMGATGLNYFDQNGDSRKPVLIGVYKNRRIISALTQFQTISNPAELSYLEETRKKDRVMLFDGRYMYRINVIYTGVEMLEIGDLNFKDHTCFLDFNLWFRYQGDVDLSKLIFLNAAEPVELGDPVRRNVTPDGLHYFLYRVKGRFRMDFLTDWYEFGEHVLGISFRHPELDRNNLIYVTDDLGMGNALDDRMVFRRMQEGQVLVPSGDWKIRNVWFFQNVIEENARGNPEYIDITGGTVGYSRFNVCVQIMPNEFILRSLIPKEWVGYIIIGCLVIFLLMPFFHKIPMLDGRSRAMWPIQFFMSLLLLLALQYHAINTLGGTYYLTPIMAACQMLWWLIPAHFISVGVRRFIWDPLEEKTGRTIPHVVKNALSLIIFVAAVFGIVAFVFDQPLTSLLASTGVAAMIFGLALQVNISNIFSGIAINIERPFRVGDWVKIDQFKEGRVIDINWRSTRIKTRDDTILCIPNSQASETSIENFSYPDDGYFKYFTVHVDPSQPPERVKKILLDAAMSTDGVERDPAPSTRFLGLTSEMTGESESWAANYLVSIYVRDYGKKYAHNEAVWSSIWMHLRRAGIQPVMQRQEMLLTFEGVRQRRMITSQALGLLDELDIFRPFSTEARSELSQRMRRHKFYPGEAIVQQGETGKSLFMVEEGVVSVRVKFDLAGQPVEVARMGAGNFFGEMALLTGEKRTATIVALTETNLYEITKEDIAPFLEEEPRISEALSDILTQRRMATESQRQSGDGDGYDQQTLAAQIFNRIQTFFGFKRG